MFLSLPLFSFYRRFVLASRDTWRSVLATPELTELTAINQHGAVHHELLNNCFRMSVVVVAPHIGPFSISDGPANSGDMVSATCSIMKGDFPVEIVWRFNGRAIGFNDPDVTITRINKHMSALSIESVAARHAGEYTCVATNRAGNVSHSTTLAVNGIYLRREQARLHVVKSSSAPYKMHRT